MRPYTFKDYKEQYTKAPNCPTIQIDEKTEKMLWDMYNEYMSRMDRDYPYGSGHEHWWPSL